MKVGFLAQWLPGGGAERVFVDVAEHFAELGHAVSLFALAGVRDGQRAIDPRVEVVSFGASGTLGALLPVYRAIRERELELVFSTLKHVSIAVETLRATTGRPFEHVIRAANTYQRELQQGPRVSRWAFRAALGRAHRSASRTVCVSQGVASDLTSHFGVPGPRLSVIYNPVYDEQLAQLARADTGIAELDRRQGYRVVAAGRLVPQKGFDTLLRAFAQASSGNGRAGHLYILGEGPERGALQALARELGVERQVTLVGEVENPFAYLAKASLFVLSSRFEGLPNVLIQALCLGTPALATDCESGPGEILTDASAGSLVAVDDVSALAAGLQSAAATPDRRIDPAPFRSRYAKSDRCADYERLARSLVARR